MEGPKSWLELLVTIFVTVMASGGFWTMLQKRSERKGAVVQLLLGLAHDRIIHLGFSYLDRGWLTKDEYEDYVNYLYKPYSAFGGNGLAERVFKDVSALPIKGKYQEREKQNVRNNRSSNDNQRNAPSE